MMYYMARGASSFCSPRTPYAPAPRARALTSTRSRPPPLTPASSSVPSLLLLPAFLT